MTKEKKAKTMIMIKRESVLESAICDALSLIFLGGFFWFNYNFIGGSYFVNFLIISLALLYAFAKPTTEKKLITFSGVSEKKLQEITKILEEKN